MINPFEEKRVESILLDEKNKYFKQIAAKLDADSELIQTVERLLDNNEIEEAIRETADQILKIIFEDHRIIEHFPAESTKRWKILKQKYTDELIKKKAENWVQERVRKEAK